MALVRGSSWAIPLRAADRSIFARLLILSAAIALPTLILAGVLSWLYANSERQVIDARRLDVAANAVHILDREVARRLAALQTLASSLELQTSDLAAFHRLASKVGQQLDVAIVLTEQNGQQIVSTMLPFGSPLPVTQNLAPIAQVFQSSGIVVSDLLIGTVARRPLVALYVPVFQNDKVARVLNLTIYPAALGHVLEEAGLPESWIAGILDRKGVIIARNRNADQFVGTSARPIVVQVASGNEMQGNFSNVTLENIEVENVFRRSPLTGWIVVIAVPSAIMNAPLYQAFWIIGLSAIGVLLLVLALAAYSGNKISGPVSALYRSAQALEQGKMLAWSHNAVTEFNAVGRTLERAQEIRQQRDLARAELDRTSALLETVITSTPEQVYAKDLESRTILRNPASLAAIGKVWSEVEGKSEIEWHSNRQEAEQILANDRKVVEAGAPLQFEEQFTTSQGVRLLLSTKSPLIDENGEIFGTVGVSTDITERDARARHIEFIMRELLHRSKNLLTIIQSIARQTIRQSSEIQAFERNFIGRLTALSTLHDLLVNEEWRGASLEAIAKAQVRPFAQERVRLAGPEVFFRPDMAQIIAMVIHELATNASKYGALSNSSGKVDLTWNLTEQSSGQMLSITWQENGGPVVVPAHRKGFGSVVLERMATQIPGAVVNLSFPAEGVVWRLEVSLAEMVKQPELSNGSKASTTQKDSLPEMSVS